MKKTLLPLIIVVALLALVVVPAAAGQGGPGQGRGPGTSQATPQPTPPGQGVLTTYRQSGPRGVFAIVGTVSAIDLEAKSITVKVLRGNKLVRPYLNTEILITTTVNTRYLDRNGDTVTAITLEDLAVGDAISLNGRVSAGIWTAQRITRGANLECLP